MELIFLDDLSTDEINSDFINKYYKDGILDLSFLFVSDFKSAKKLRDIIIVLFEALWLDSIWKSRFTLIADELNNNSIEYWSKYWELNCMKVFLRKEDDKVFINLEVEDTWNWSCSKTSKEMEDLRYKRLEKWFDNHDSIRWRWLFLIITKLVDELYFKDSDKGWLIVWINKVITF